MDLHPPIRAEGLFSPTGKKSAALKFQARNRICLRSRMYRTAPCERSGIFPRRLEKREESLSTRLRDTTKMLSAIRFCTFNMGGAKTKQAGATRDTKALSWTI